MERDHGFLTNRDLFSNYYLEEHLPETDDWEPENEAVFEDAYNEVQSLYESERSNFENYNESQLEKNFIRPVFEALGHVYEVEETVERGRRRPDYALFGTEDVREQAIEGKDEGRDFYRTRSRLRTPSSGTFRSTSCRRAVRRSATSRTRVTRYTSTYRRRP